MICDSIRKMTDQEKIDKIYKTFVHTINYKALMSEIKDLNKREDILKDYCTHASGDVNSFKIDVEIQNANQNLCRIFVLIHNFI